MTDSSDYLPEVVYTAKQVAALDKRFIGHFGVDGFELMQRAARDGFAEFARYWAMPGTMCVICGPGNNGGDGYLIAKHAMAAGWSVRMQSLVDVSALKGDAAKAADAFQQAGGEIAPFVDRPIDADVVVDAVLGTGLDRNVEGRFAQAIDCINDAAARGAGVFSVDIASGIDGSTGHVWQHAVTADVTATFIGLKLGMFTGQGPAHCGEIEFSALDAPAELYDDQPYIARRLTHRALRKALQPRRRDAHKGDNGHVLCVGGYRGMGGSIRMSAEAALRAGAGLVSVACHPDHAGAMSQARPELMCLGADGADSIEHLVAAADVIAVGPGLGQAEWGAALWDAVMASDKPLVVDADALNRLAASARTRGNWILTPHPGEAARLLGCKTAEVVDDRVSAVQEIARRYDAVTVLKGAGSLIATPDELWLCTDGNPGMAVGGMGDLLTGVIAGLAAQGLDLSQAASLGVYVHARAGDEAAVVNGQRGLLPSDLLMSIRHFVNPDRA